MEKIAHPFYDAVTIDKAPFSLELSAIFPDICQPSGNVQSVQTQTIGPLSSQPRAESIQFVS
jgi:hypothetical protein